MHVAGDSSIVDGATVDGGEENIGDPGDPGDPGGETTVATATDAEDGVFLPEFVSVG